MWRMPPGPSCSSTPGVPPSTPPPSRGCPLVPQLLLHSQGLFCPTSVTHFCSPALGLIIPANQMRHLRAQPLHSLLSPCGSGSHTTEGSRALTHRVLTHGLPPCPAYEPWPFVGIVSLQTLPAEPLPSPSAIFDRITPDSG